MYLKVIAGRTSGFAGADLANLVNEAALLAARAGRDAVTMADFSEAIERVVAGLEKKAVSLATRRKNSGIPRSRSCDRGFADARQ